MRTYKTPGVYVEEISTLSPSVAEVSTAVPAFIGYTEKIPTGYSTNQPVRINSMLDYKTLFGGAIPAQFEVTVGDKVSVRIPTADTSRNFLLYYALKLYFTNGGGSCYIVPIGTYGSTIPTLNADAFKSGLDALEKEDEPTLIVFPDAVNLATPGLYYQLCNDTLTQCNKMQDRFGVFDVLESDGDGMTKPYAAAFRDKVSSSFLKYGAAYMPFLKSLISYSYDEGSIDRKASVKVEMNTIINQSIEIQDMIIEVDFPDGAIIPSIVFAESTDQSGEFNVEANERKLTIFLSAAGDKVKAILEAWEAWTEDNPNTGFDLSLKGGAAGGKTIKVDTDIPDWSKEDGVSLYTLADKHTDVYNKIKLELSNQRVVLPPSAAMVGIYAQVDRNMGVWKAPANVPVSGISGPTKVVTHDQQALLNVDATSGKSINVIRSFTGKGTLVWGARTLAGNDNEWRYISVRRLFIMIEESTQKSTAFAVFEANDTSTWLKVKAMIDSFLYGLWQQGALAGPTPESAYFVNVGLGKTMTADDILNGRLIIEIGVAAVRPAEFIILRFSHKLQEA